MVEKVELKEVFQKPITGEWGSEGDKVKVLRTTNFTNSGVLDLTNVVLRDISDKKIEQKKLCKGDIIIEKSGGSPTQPVGRVVYFDEEGVYLCNNFTSVLRPQNGKAHSKYLLYMLFGSYQLGLTNFFQNKTTGISNLQLTRYLDKLKIPLPPLNTQQKIAQILDNAAALRNKTAQLIEEYNLLAQSIFLELFGDPVVNPMGWEKVPFKNLFQQGKKSIKPEHIAEGQKYIGLEHIEKETGDILEVVELAENELKSNKFWFNEEYVLYGKLRPYLNKVASPNFEGICSTDIIPFKPIENKSNKSFLIYLMKGKWFVNYANERTSGANLPRVSPKDILKFQTINPPIKLQTLFAQKIANIEAQKALARQELKESEDLFNCLLQKAFKGQLQ